MLIFSIVAEASTQTLADFTTSYLECVIIKAIRISLLWRIDILYSIL